MLIDRQAEDYQVVEPEIGCHGHGGDGELVLLAATADSGVDSFLEGLILRLRVAIADRPAKERRQMKDEALVGIAALGNGEGLRDREERFAGFEGFDGVLDVREDELDKELLPSLTLTLIFVSIET